ncbi:SHOCT domain-containing protein [Ornithinimicrobium sp. CNJ-824]|uniref:SHOCT domain-containing protein n=1 Tax=Ornithinimicrobium sp. CNJ-824 TaxID=1904966 RepID=UPI001EDA76D4|nr:SHOCT domain-containing protein [Ornithinimicrobium sp. CNJ-824]
MVWFWIVLLVVGVALLGYTAVRVLVGGLTDASEGSAPPASRSRAREILDERYAAGELSTQEYEERRAVLARGEDGP